MVMAFMGTLATVLFGQLNSVSASAHIRIAKCRNRFD